LPTPSPRSSGRRGESKKFFGCVYKYDDDDLLAAAAVAPLR
jgi:hypothetical protein